MPKKPRSWGLKRAVAFLLVEPVNQCGLGLTNMALFTANGRCGGGADGWSKAGVCMALMEGLRCGKRVNQGSRALCVLGQRRGWERVWFWRGSGGSVSMWGVCLCARNVGGLG